MKRKIVEIYKQWCIWMHRYINGVQGAISLFLALCMLPLVSTALLLVESVRYQSAMQLLGELIDSAQLSTLAHYDDYLDERFGMMSLSQDSFYGSGNMNETLTTCFTSYLDENKNLLGKSVSVNSSIVTGAFPLSDPDILQRQVLEFSETMVPVKLAEEGLASIDLVEPILKIMGISKEQKESMDLVETVADDALNMSQSLLDVSNAILDAGDDWKKFDDKRQAYQQAYTQFKDAILELVTVLQTEEAAQNANNADNSMEDSNAENEDHPTQANTGESQEVTTAKSAVVEAAKDYKKAANEMISPAEAYYDDATQLLSTISQVIKSYTDINSEVNKVEKNVEQVSKTGGAAQNNHNTSSNNTETKNNQTNGSNVSSNNPTGIALKAVTDVFEDINQQNWDIFRQSVNDQINKLEEFIQNQPVTSTWTDAKVKNEYRPVDTTMFGNNVQTTLNTLAESIIPKMDESSIDNLKNMSNLLGQVVNLEFFWDSNLNAKVSGLYNSVPAELFSWSGDGLQKIITGIDKLVNCFDAEKWSWWTVIEFCRSILSIVGGLLLFLSGLIIFFGSLTGSILKRIFQPTELGKRLLMAGYATYNLPSRTTVRSGKKTLTGYSYSNVLYLAGGQMTSNFGGSLEHLADTNSLTVPNDMFYGAELEYLFVGEDDEITNQISTFTALIDLRCIVAFVLTYKDVAINSLATGANVFPAMGLLIRFLVALLEGILDTMVLVNGGKVAIINKKLYVTHINQWIKDVLQNSMISRIAKDRIQSMTGGLKDKGSQSNQNALNITAFNMDYNMHIWLMILLMTDETEYWKRLQNLIQMEGKVSANTRSETFSLDDAYTYLYSDVNCTLNPMFNLDMLTENGLFTFQQTGYSGY